MKRKLPVECRNETLRVVLEVLQFEVMPLSGIVTKIHSFHKFFFCWSMVVVVIVIWGNMSTKLVQCLIHIFHVVL